MRRLFLSLCFIFSPHVEAQIYADFAVSHGGTSLGSFRVELEHIKAPRPTAAFIGLATGQRPWIHPTTGELKINTPFYDGLVFHRLIHNFVIQGGDPLGTGSGGPGYVFQDQYHADLRHDGAYLLSSAKSANPNTNGSQFFITLAPTPHLDDKHSIFGEVISGKSIIDGFMDSVSFPVIDADGDDNELGTEDDNNRPVQDIIMNSVTISGPSLATFDINDPALRLPVLNGVCPEISYNAAESKATFTMDLAAQCRYRIAASSDLETWILQSANLHAYQNFLNLSFNFSGITESRLFWRFVEVSYEQLPNSPADLTDTAHTLAFSDRSGNTLTLTFNGAGGGIWTHTDFSSGTFSVETWDEYIPLTGGQIDTGNYAYLIPLGFLDITFDTPAGPDSWTSLSGNISFHTETNGFAEMTASGSTPVNLSFTYTPN